MKKLDRFARFRQATHRLSIRLAAVLAVAVLLVASVPAYADNSGEPPVITPELRQELADEGIYYIDNQCEDVLTGNPGGVNGGSDSGIWNSQAHDGTVPPYILEQFMIELLKDIASKRGVPESDTVTQDHVIALIAFAYGEGGGITNQDWWNPFNTGINAPDLLASGHSTSGVQAFKSFDAGVEANARVMSGGHPQTRLGKVLSDPKSTVKDFFTVLTYYNDPGKLGAYYTKGDLEWATASLADPAGYENNYMNNVLPPVMNNWNQKAGALMRGSNSDPHGSDPSKLTYHPVGSGGSTSPTITGAAVTNSCGVPTGGGTLTGYQNPLRDITHQTGPHIVKGPIRNRIDEGVDYAGTGPLYAVGPGVVVQVNNNSGWPLHHWINYQITDGKAKGLFMYIAEDCTPAPGVAVGMKVDANTVLCNMTNTSPGNEMGWAIPVKPGAKFPNNALASKDYVEGHPMTYGINFSQFMQAVGAPPGDQSKSTGGVLGTLAPGWPTWP